MPIGLNTRLRRLWPRLLLSSLVGLPLAAATLVTTFEQTAASDPPAGKPAVSQDDSPSRPAERPTTAFQKLDVRHLPNAIQVHPKVISGGLPEGEAAFRELQSLGVRTIVSVDAAKPDLKSAERFGLRYVHLPHGYDGISVETSQRLAKAVRDLPGPIYLHCHHGKHRSPASAAVACVGAGLIEPEVAGRLLKTAGTNPRYVGLYRAAEQAKRFSPERLDALPADFPAIAQVSPTAEAMVAIEEHFGRLQKMSKSDWRPPTADAADKPAHQALLLNEQFVEMLRLETTRAKPEAYRRMTTASRDASAELDAALRKSPFDEAARKAADSALQRLGGLCADCHAEFRDR